ncbi:bifunctional metallophosphatase/5'-nucleotidase [uncultured Desulfovibrio sp.]|uniref:bifunctional metallophosphatase/5'-nucleotidase n=1 Tax=uncultured Desulfovibrio sp. TaxID=167968 RepID=UPI002638B26F|nr:bifunctional metallophosphatase/5'-nucleotidase [uncultured Desulfovibrio sp.]
MRRTRGAGRSRPRRVAVLALWAALVLWATHGPARAGEATPGGELRILHTNDTHAHLAGVDERWQPCSTDEACRGGMGRIAAAIDAARRESGDVLALDAGDQFQGTLFYAVEKWPVLAEFDRHMPYDAMTLGNHEFDEGCDALRRFLDAQPIPVVAANIAPDRGCPLFGSRILPFLVRKMQSESVGIVGLANDRVTAQAQACPHTLFLDAAQSLRQAVAELEAGGVRRIVALSHLGLPADRELARQVDGVDIIVGGHTHTWLGPGSDTGPYPLVERSPSGQPVLIVTAARATRYIGDLTVTFDARGIPARWWGGPRELTPECSRREELSALTARHAAVLERYQARMVGRHDVDAPDGMEACRAGDCFGGMLLADAFLDVARPRGADMALVNAGSLRAAIPPGEVSRGALLTAIPFGNDVVLREYTGAQILRALEHGVAGEDGRGPALLQTAGLRYVVDASRPVGSRIVSADVMSPAGESAPLAAGERYRVALPAYLARGGDGYDMLREGRPLPLAPVKDVDAAAAYLEAHSPLTEMRGGRIRRIGTGG